jgi:signal peptidase I
MAGRLRFSLLGCLLIPVVLAGWALPVFFKTYRQPSGSMLNTIGIGDHVVTRRRAEPKRGDIIVFDYPLEPKTQFMKRLVALPGETVEIRDKQLFINGKKIDESYALHLDPQTFPKHSGLPEPYLSRDQFGPFTVPPNSFFVMGDNRDRSSDSRFWGTVPREHVRGVVVLIIGKRGFIRP